MENVILKHYLLRRIDLIPEAGVHESNSQIISRRINLTNKNGDLLLKKLGVVDEDKLDKNSSQKKYIYNRKYKNYSGCENEKYEVVTPNDWF